jgi:hypothetical protein
VYSVAYGNGWLSTTVEAERAASREITLLLAKVSLGHCKDFGARCRSSRGDAAAEAAGVSPGLIDWGPAVGRHGEAGFNRPPMRPEAGPNELFQSVTGTEGDLAWAQNPRLRAEGAKLGRQYITFDTNQAYPELVLRLERRPEVTRRFAYAAEQEAIGKDDKEMAHGTIVYVQDFSGLGVVCPGYTWNMLSANSHNLRFGDELPQAIKLRGRTWHVVGHSEMEREQKLRILVEWETEQKPEQETEIPSFSRCFSPRSTHLCQRDVDVMDVPTGGACISKLYENEEVEILEPAHKEVEMVQCVQQGWVDKDVYPAEMHLGWVDKDALMKLEDCERVGEVTVAALMPELLTEAPAARLRAVGGGSMMSGTTLEGWLRSERLGFRGSATNVWEHWFCVIWPRNPEPPPRTARFLVCFHAVSFC